NALFTASTGGSNANSLTLAGYGTGATTGTCTIAAETGRVQINFNEASATVQNYTLGGSNSAGAGFNGSGGLVLPVVGDTVTYESPYWIKGHTGFMMAPPAMGGGTIANYHIEYQIDTGGGWSGWKNAFRQTITAVADYTAGQYTITGVAAGDMAWVQEGDHITRSGPNFDFRRNAKIAVGGISGTTITLDKTHNNTNTNRAFYVFHLPEETIDYQAGFKLKVRITTIIANTTGMTSLYFRTFQTPTSRGYQLPLDVAPVELTNLVSGSDIVILGTGTTTILVSTDETPATSYSTTIDPNEYPNIDICIYKAGYIPYILRNLSLTTAGLSLPMNQAVDPSYVP
ncbi:MAG TPA: hypothetical protein PK735_15170, partial [Flavobacteriales bacterium]|nr:hypothetical protein [Flavobacteriales bacterium]